MCPNRTLSPPLLLMVAAASIVPSSRTLTCACPFDSDAQAGTSSSERICVLNTTAGTSSLWALASIDALPPTALGDRKSTRLNSSHTVISYAVFCLKKKNKQTPPTTPPTPTTTPATPPPP